VNPDRILAGSPGRRLARLSYRVIKFVAPTQSVDLLCAFPGRTTTLSPGGTRRGTGPNARCSPWPDSTLGRSDFPHPRVDAMWVHKQVDARSELIRSHSSVAALCRPPPSTVPRPRQRGVPWLANRPPPLLRSCCGHPSREGWLAIRSSRCQAWRAKDGEPDWNRTGGRGAAHLEIAPV
jgi:hypothetical protein